MSHTSPFIFHSSKLEEVKGEEKNILKHATHLYFDRLHSTATVGARGEINPLPLLLGK